MSSEFFGISTPAGKLILSVRKKSRESILPIKTGSLINLQRKFSEPGWVKLYCTWMKLMLSLSMNSPVFIVRSMEVSLKDTSIICFGNIMLKFCKYKAAALIFPNSISSLSLPSKIKSSMMIFKRNGKTVSMLSASNGTVGNFVAARIFWGSGIWAMISWKSVRNVWKLSSLFTTAFVNIVPIYL